jgi:hypothetical protein
MSYTDFTLGKNARKGSTGPLGSLKGKPTDKMKTGGAGKAGLGQTSNAGGSGGGRKGGRGAK